MKLLRTSRGITLIELLLVLALSSMVLTLGASFVVSMLKASDRTMTETTSRNETVLILDKLNKTMENADDIEVDPDQKNIDGSFKLFTVIETEEVDPNNDGIFDKVETRKVIHINDSDLLIDGSKINSENYSLEKSSFTLQNDQLVCKLFIQLRHGNKKPYEILKIYTFS